MTGPIRWLLPLALLGAVGLGVWIWGPWRLRDWEHDLIIDWLSCEECDETARDSLVASVGERAVPLLSVFLEGLPDTEDQNLVRRVTAQWNDIQPEGIDSLEFIQHYVRAMEEGAQRRAAVLLSQLERWEVLDTALGEAVTRQYSDEMTAYLRFLLQERYLSDPTLRQNSIQGTVRAPNDEGIPGIQVTLGRCGLAPVPSSPPAPGTCWTVSSHVNTETNANGSYAFSGLAPGVYQVSVNPPPDFPYEFPPPYLIQLLPRDQAQDVELQVLLPR